MMRGELEAFIEEDVGFCDLSSVTVPDIDVDAKIIAKEEGILAGLTEAGEIFSYFGLKTTSELFEGSKIDDGAAIINVSGSSRSILTAERLAINFLGRMSGIATLTSELVKKSSGNAVIAGTRKTTPGFRKYEKKAIVLGGGDPHRFNLSDAIMIKDNHIKVAGLKGAIDTAKGIGFTKKIEVEVESFQDALSAAELGVHIIMLDNMGPEEIEDTIKSMIDAGLRDKILLEASGGITIENVGRYAETGVDVISVGSLTTAARWLDFGLYIE